MTEPWFKQETRIHEAKYITKIPRGSEEVSEVMRSCYAPFASGVMSGGDSMDSTRYWPTDTIS